MQHLAMIMDGNRRWAKDQKLQAVTLGHRKGVDAVKAVISFCLKKGIKYLSLFTFSLENFRRENSEQRYIFSLLKEVLHTNMFKLMEQGVRIKFVGDRTLFPEQARAAIEEAEEKTKHLDKLQLNMLFCYGAQQELVAATKKLALKVEQKKLAIEDIDEKAICKELWTWGTPDPDLIIRTGRRSRLSNFLLFQAAYSELMFLDCYWPEVTEEQLEQCFNNFHTIQRNFGI